MTQTKLKQGWIKLHGEFYLTRKAMIRHFKIKEEHFSELFNFNTIKEQVFWTYKPQMYFCLKDFEEAIKHYEVWYLQN